jgi:hypothetical protein
MEATYRQANGRYKFLEAVKTKNAEVLKTLHDQVLPIFKSLHFYAQEVWRGDTDDRLFADHPGVKSDRGPGELLAVLAITEALARPPDAGDRERSLNCRISEAPQEDVHGRSNEERWAFLKHSHDSLIALGVTEMYVAVGDKVPIPSKPVPGVKWSEIEASPHPKFANVRAAISEWAESYNLTDSWILETVVQTLLSWMYNPEYEEGLRWAHAGYLGQIPQDPPRFQIEPRPFEPRKAFEDRAKEALKAFCSSHEYFLEVGHDHKYAFEWLAQYQTRLDSPSKIAIEFERQTGERRTPSAIILAYQAAAKEIGLTLRRTLRGPSAKKRS